MKRTIRTATMMVAFAANTGAAGSAPEEGKAPEAGEVPKPAEKPELPAETDSDREESGNIGKAVAAEVERLMKTGMEQGAAEFNAVTIATSVKLTEMGDKRISIDRSSRAVFHTLIGRPEFKMLASADGSANINKWLEKVWNALPDENKIPRDKNPSKFYNYNTAEKMGNPMAKGINSLGAWMKRNQAALFPEFVKVVDEDAAALKTLLKACETLAAQTDLPDALRAELEAYYKSKVPAAPEKPATVEAEKAA